MPGITLRQLVLAAVAMLSIGGASQAATSSGAGAHEPYNDDEVVSQASEFFATGAKELSDVLGKVLKEKGHPIAIVKGEEAGGAIGVGLRYGHGELVYKGGASRKVYWQGPSIGFDLGANAVKTFVLVYGLPKTDALYHRFPGVEGSLYFVGGFGVNYLQLGDVTLAPVRFGVGWRQGIALNYIKFTRDKSYNPF